MFDIRLLLLIFVVGSIMGWIFEFIVRSFKKGYLVNPGFLEGFYLPIYGFGAVMVYLINLINIDIWLKILLFGISNTSLELVTGIILKNNGISLWKYKKSNSITYKGLICLKCSIIWVIFSLIFVYLIIPELLLINSFGFTCFFISIISIDFLIKILK